MIVNNQVSHEAEYIGDIQENRVGIDKANIDFITTLLTSNLYSKPFESFLRETIANAYDSHLEAGTDKQIILLFEGKNEYNYTVSIRDYGTGLSPERFNQIYRNIGGSTKRESNDYIGAFGIGRMSCLAVADTANITSYYNGKKYAYIMYKNGTGINIDKLSETDTEYPDGLEVSVKTTKYSSYDWDKAIYPLCLFDNLYIVCKGECSYRLRNTVEDFNKRKVYNYNNIFYTCNLLRDWYTYYRIGNILYQADDEHTYINTKGLIINIPIGTVDITPSREDLQYTEFTNKSLKLKSKEAQEELQRLATEYFNKGYTLNTFYTNVVASDSLLIPKEDSSKFLPVDKRDVKLELNKATINGKEIPDGFIKFLNNIKYNHIKKENIHKVLNLKRRYFNDSIDNLLSGNFDLVNKLDKTTKGVTLDYYKDYNNGCPKVILIYNGLEFLKREITTYCEINTPDGFSIEKCVDFLFDNLTVETLSNDAIPEDYIKAYRQNKRDARKAISSNNIQVRVYRCGTYSMYSLRTILKDTDKGFSLYTVNTKDDTILRQLPTMFMGYNSLKYIFSMKAEDIHLVENDKRFINLDTFLMNKNNLLTKVFTARAILDNFIKLEYKGIDYYSLPVYNKFINCNKVYAKMARNMHSYDKYILDLYKYYQENKWLNTSLIDYYKVNEEDITAYKEYNRMCDHHNLIIQQLACVKLGNHPKVGLKMIPTFDSTLIKRV